MLNGMLLNGGPYDGQYRKIETNQVQNMCVRFPKRDTILPAATAVTVDYDQFDVYRIVSISVDRTAQNVLLYEGIHPNQAVQLLMQNYRPNHLATHSA